MNLDLKTRMVRLRLKQKDAAEMLNRSGLNTCKSEVSVAINRLRDYPKLDVVRNELSNLLTKLERERGIKQCPAYLSPKRTGGTLRS